MACYKHTKLPPYKLTGRFGAALEVRSIHRGSRSVKQPEAEPEQDQGHSSDSSFHMDDTLQPSLDDEDACLEPTLHDLQSRAAVSGWDKLRRQMLLTAVEMSAMPEGQTCFVCAEEAIFRCQQCGPLIHYCYLCYQKQHEVANFFHVPEKWEVSIFGFPSHSRSLRFYLSPAGVEPWVPSSPVGVEPLVPSFPCWCGTLGSIFPLLMWNPGFHLSPAGVEPWVLSFPC